MQKHRVLGAVISSLLLRAFLSASTYPQEKLPKRKISLCGKNYLAWVASTDADRTRGFMGFRELKNTEAMLFVFDEEEPRSFWMKNVSYDLDIAYFDSKKKLVSYLTMKATSPLMKEEMLPAYSSQAPAKYAVEVKGGTLSRLPKNCSLVF